MSIFLTYFKCADRIQLHFEQSVLGLDVVLFIRYLSSYLMTRIKVCATAAYKRPMFSYVLYYLCTTVIVLFKGLRDQADHMTTMGAYFHLIKGARPCHGERHCYFPSFLLPHTLRIFLIPLISHGRQS